MLPAVIGAIGALGAAGLSAYAQHKINQQNLLNNEHRFAAETELANTAHQREVIDLRHAGLNPILSAGGSGAGVPTQAAYEGQAPDMSSLATLGDAVNNARATSSQLAVNDANIAAKQGDIAESKLLQNYYQTPKGEVVARAHAVKNAAPENAMQAGMMAALGVFDGILPRPSPSANTAKTDGSAIDRQVEKEYPKSSLTKDALREAFKNTPAKDKDDFHQHQEDYEHWLKDEEEKERLDALTPWNLSYRKNKKRNRRKYA